MEILDVKNDASLVIRCLVYNQEPYIKDCLDGIVNQQTNFPFVAIVHDDASTDRSSEIIKEYAKNYPNIIKPIFETQNLYSKHDGSIKKRIDKEVCIYHPKYIAFCEGDDYWTDPLKLQKQVDFMESHPDYSMCFHNVELINAIDKIKIGQTKRYNEDTEVPIEDIILKGGGHCPTCSIIYRTECLDDYPDFCKQFIVGDYPLQIFLANKGKVFYMSDIMGVYRINSIGSWSQRNSKEYQGKRNFILKQYRIILKHLEFYEKFNEYTNHKFSESFKLKGQKDLTQFVLYNNVYKRIKKVPRPKRKREQLRYYLVKYRLALLSDFLRSRLLIKF